MRLSACFLLVLALCACTPSPVDETAPSPPNVIVMMADDLGWGDIGANGGTVIQTPHIDALAAQGVRLTDGYVSAAVCSPSRAGFYTGRHQQRHGFEFNIAGRDTDMGMSLQLSSYCHPTDADRPNGPRYLHNSFLFSYLRNDSRNRPTAAAADLTHCNSPLRCMSAP